MMLVLHDDAEREYAYGPANGLPDTKVGTFSQSLMDEAKQRGWVVISMKSDWKRIFRREARATPRWLFSTRLLSGMYRLGAPADRNKSRRARCMLLADREQGASGARMAGRPN